MMSSEEDTDCGVVYGLFGEKVLQQLNQNNINTNNISTSGSTNCSNNNNCSATTTTVTSATISTIASNYTGNFLNCISSGGGSSSSSTTTLNSNNHNNNNKRTRQRVDAGEPRNSYSSIPNFTSRPTFMSGGLYGAIFSQTQQHFSLFSGSGISGHPSPSVVANSNSNTNFAGIGGVSNNSGNLIANNNPSNNHCAVVPTSSVNVSNQSNGFGPVKMLNELLGRQVKQAQDATGLNCNSSNVNNNQTSPTGATIIGANGSVNHNSISENTNLDNFLANNNNSLIPNSSRDCVSTGSVNLKSCFSENNVDHHSVSHHQSPFNQHANNSRSPNQVPSVNCTSASKNNTNSGNVINDSVIRCSGNNYKQSESEDQDNQSDLPTDENNDLLISSTSTPSSQCSPVSHTGLNHGTSGGNCGVSVATSNAATAVAAVAAAAAVNANDLAHHMLRNILQQSKKDLLAFDQEMQRVVAQRQLNVDSSNLNNIGTGPTSINSDQLCAMISDSAKQLTKQMVKLEMNVAASEANNNNNSVDDMNEPRSEMKMAKKNVDQILEGVVENGVTGLNTSTHNGHHHHHGKGNSDNNNNNSNMMLNDNDSEDNDDDNSIHSATLNELKSGMKNDDDEMDMIMEQGTHNTNSMDKLDQKRRHASVSPIISSSSSSTTPIKGSNSGDQPVVALDMKRARVENIVSTMRSSPALPMMHQNQGSSSGQGNAVNGCKKRKLYHPQQHDNSAADRYAAAAAAGLNLGLNLQNLLLANNHLQQTFLANAHLSGMDDDMDDDTNGERNGDVAELSDGGEDMVNTGSLDGTQLLQKRVEKNALKSQLQSMQEQLAEMQQKYMQLCTRMEQESEPTNTIHDVDDNSESELMLNENNQLGGSEDNDDAEDEDDVEDSIVDRRCNNPSEDIEMDDPSTAVITTTTTPLMSTTTTISSNRLHNSQRNPDNNNNNINNKIEQLPNEVGGLPQPMMTKSLSQVMNKMIPQTPGKISHNNMHPAAAVAAALHSHIPIQNGSYGAKGASSLLQHLHHNVPTAGAHDLLHSQSIQQQGQQQHSLSNAISNAMYLGVSQKLFLEQQEARQHLMAAVKEDEHRDLMMIRDRDRHQRDRQSVPVNSQIRDGNQSGTQQQTGGHHHQMKSNRPVMSGNELEGLAEMLKSEITASLSHLVDTIVTRFLHQKRFIGKQSEAAAAAAEQLSKDLMMASQLLDRKSPRTKVADRPIGPNQSAAMFQTPKHSQSATNNQNMLQANHSKVAALNQVAAAALYNSMNQFCLPPTSQLPGQTQSSQLSSSQSVVSSSAGNNSISSGHMDNHHSSGNGNNPEQTEALPLVVQPKKKRHKVTDTRITPRTVSRILAQDGIIPSQQGGNGNVPSGLLNPSSSLSLTNHLFKHDEINNNNLNNSNNNSGNNNRTNINNGQDQNHMKSPVSSAQSAITSPHASAVVTTASSINANNSGNSNNATMNGCGISQKGYNGNSSNGSANSPMTSPQSRQSLMGGGNPNAPLHFSQNYHPSMPSLPTSQQSMMPVSLPTSVAIPNPSLPEESDVFSPYSPLFSRHGHGDGNAVGGGGTGPGNILNGNGLPYGLSPSQFNHHHHHHHIKMSSSPPGLGGMIKARDSPPLPMHSSTLLHPALLAAAHHGNSPDYGAHLRHSAMDNNNNTNDRSSDCNDLYDGIQPTSSTLTPMHLRKAKLMFFWVRYPSSAVLKMYFPDIRFNKNNTAQLVKWFSNFREFYYIQMEKYARQAVTEGTKSAEELFVNGDSEIYRVLNLHYNRNNHIEVPLNFRYVVEQTLREFFKSIQAGKDQEQSWKKSIYKIISRLDDPVPEYFKSPNFLEQLE